MAKNKLRLGVNIDHVATVRNARGGVLPDPVRAAHLAIEAGADGITAHLREDRRHIRDLDMERLMAELTAPLNMEMGATAEMAAIAARLRPHAVCLVPESRQERTTEGGLDVLGQFQRLKPMIAELGAFSRVSLFIEPDPRAVAAGRDLGAPVVELHTGAWCEAVAHNETDKARAEFARIEAAAKEAERLGVECHAGHGLDYATARKIAAIPTIAELNIGHYLVGEALFIGLAAAIKRMRAAMDEGRAASEARA